MRADHVSATRKVLFAAVSVVACCFSVRTQTWTQYDQGTPPQHAAGVSPVGSYLSSDLGTVNLSNGSLNLSLPMGTAGGRGFSIPITLSYSSKVWSVSHDSVYWSLKDMDVDMAYAHYAAADTYEDIYFRVAPGWTIGGLPLLKRQNVGITPCPGGGNANYLLEKLTVVLPDKGEIELRDDQLDGAPFFTNCTFTNEYRGSRWHATDGSGAIFINDVDNGIVNNNLNGTLITGDGMRYRFVTISGLLARVTSITDRNGNQITVNYSTQNGGSTTEFIDQLGRSTKVEQNVPDPANGSVILPLLVTLKGYQGTPEYYKAKTELLSQHIRSDYNYNGLPIKTGTNDRFGYCYGGGQPPSANYIFTDSYCGFQERIDTQPAVSQFILPDGRSLQFSYNLYGELAEVVLPTGGKLQYDYTGFLSGFPSGNTLGGEYQGQMNAVTNIDRAVTERRTYPDGSNLEQTSTYLFGPQTFNGTSYACTEVKAYAGSSLNGTLLSDQRHFFLPSQRYLSGSHGSMSGTGYSLWSTGVEWRTETRDAAGSVINASEQDWAQRTAVSWSTGYTQEQPANDNRVSEVRRYLETGAFAKTDTFYDNDTSHYPRANNVNEVKEYDFDQSLKRRTTNTYVTGSYQTDDSIHLISLVQQQSIYDSSGTNEVARSVNEYDVYAADGNHALLQDYGPVIGHDNAYGPGKVTRGNVTASGRWLKTNNTTIYSYLRYDTLGNPVSNKDANQNVTTLSYTDDFGNGSNPGAGSSGTYGATYSLPTLITSPPPTPGAPVHTARTQYDFFSGLLTGFKDRNGIITQTIYNDPFSRPTLVKSALGTSAEAHAAMYYAPTTAFGITLTNNDVLTAKDQTIPDDAVLRSWTHTDGFGRTVETWTRDPQGDDKVSTIYDALGRVKQQSNPYRPSVPESAIYSTTTYDLAGRVTSVTTPDSAVVSTYYNGNQVLVKDQMSRERMSKTDALGELTDVWEITAADDSTEAVSFPNHAEVTAGDRTKYVYDALGNLVTVTQQKGTAGTTQTRTFVYDSLKRLTSATNPESGTVSYQYDANGNLTQKTDARAVVSTYVYDALNRNTTIDYSDTTGINPDVTRSYDGAANGIGRLWESYAGGNYNVGSNVEHTKVTSYDPLGRPLSQFQDFKTNGVWSGSYTTQGSYNLAGETRTQTYPSGHSVTYTYDTAGRDATFIGSLGDGTQRNYSTEIIYSPLGGMTKEKFGTDTAIYNKLFYNSRGQLAEIRESTSYTGPSDTTWNRGAIINHYSDTCWGMCGGSNSTTPMTDNNGNLRKQEVYIPSDDQVSSYTTWWQGYDYDNLNRLQRVHEYTGNTSLDWQQEFVYDRYGNRTIHQTNTWGNGINKKDFTANVANNNRLGVPSGQSGTMSYDNAGNLTTDTYSAAAVTRAYDAENRMTSETQAGSNVVGSYSYNADGQRVRRTVAGQPSAVTTWQIYGFSGELLVEYAANAAATSPQKEYGYRNGQLLVTADITSGLPAPVFSDDFNSASLDTTKWTASDSTRVTDNGQQLQISLLPNTAGYYTAYTNSTYDLTGKSAQVEAVQAISQGGWCENFMEAVLDGNNYFLIDVGAGSIVFRSVVNGSADTTAPWYNPTTDHYWRIRHDQSANTVNFETSADGNTWATRKTVTPGFALTSLRFYLYAGAWGTGNGAPGAAKYDNFKLQGNTPTAVTTLHWLVTDQIGTPRMNFDQSGSLTVTDQSGNYVSGVTRHDYLPFGEELTSVTGLRSSVVGYAVADNLRQKFTRYERDNETGLDYANARYFASSQGRFISADPLISSGRAISPQSWNRYTYCVNSPLQLVDPSGLDWGFQDFWKHGQHLRRFAWFEGKVNQRGWQTYTGSSDIKLHDGSWVRLGSGTYTPIHPADARITLSGHDELTAAAGHAHGVVSALTGGNPIAQKAVNWAFSKIGGIDRDSALYKNTNAIGDGVVSGAFSLAGPNVGEAGEAVAAEESAANEGIYEFTAASGKTYVGQSGDIARRIGEHLRSGKLIEADLATLRTTAVPGGKTAREIAEQMRINELGGIGNLENVRNPIGKARAFLLPGGP